MTESSSNTFEHIEVQAVVKQIELCQDIYERQINSLPLTKNMKILDYACGPGLSTRQLASMMNPTKIHAIDNDEKMIQHARQYVAPLSNILFSIQDGRKTKFQDDFFDLIYVRNFFAVIPGSPRAYLKEICRILKPNGYLVVVESNNYGYCLYPLSPWVHSRRKIMKKIPYNFEIAGDLPRHLLKHGFVIEDVRLDNFKEIGPASASFREQGNQFYERIKPFARELFGSIQSMEEDKRAFNKWCDDPSRFYYETIVMFLAKKIDS
ncbi:MAG: class I SAM-dependent methyltransferase [Candidatus Helarchaeales archaeon]